jgi:hypothetical protein
MYIIQGKELTVLEVREALIKAIKEYKIKVDHDEDINLSAQEIVNLNDALLHNKKGVFATCEKEPRGNLDTGGHHYSIFYIKDGEPKRFWTYQLMKLWGCKKNKSNRGLPYWTFFSSAIGMSRLLDATDSLFNFIKRLGGCYCQIELI